jgi:phospholipid/cholesterol/gamma-HCH transport system ATP-binding protein
MNAGMNETGEQGQGRTEVVRAVELDLGNGFDDFSCRLGRGEVAAVIVPNEETALLLAQIIIGRIHPDRGNVELFGEQAALLPPKELMKVRQRCGVVYASGGLISNLKVLENLTLPLLYHTTLSRAEVEERGRAMLKRLGYAGGLMQLPGLLGTYQRKLLGLARAMLGDPELMIYESPSRGLTEEQRRFLFRTALEFHQEGRERASLFITSNPASLPLLPDATVYTLTRGSH